MRYLLDTHLIIWAYDSPNRVSREAVQLINDSQNELYFSPSSIWEIAIKNALGKKDFSVDPGALRRGLLANGYIELPITSEHAVAVAALPPLHKDPSDRILIAQATVEGITLLTADRKIAKYSGPIRKV